MFVMQIVRLNETSYIGPVTGLFIYLFIYLFHL